MSDWKDTNPKDAVGVMKSPMSVIPGNVLQEVGIALMEGARKYGRHNYRVAGVRASVYYDAAMRHLIAWWEGQDTDPDSGLSHITKAIAGLIVFRDAMINNMFNDDRPPPVRGIDGFLLAMNTLAASVINRYPEAKPPNVKPSGDIQPVPPSGYFPSNSTIDPDRIEEIL